MRDYLKAIRVCSLFANALLEVCIERSCAPTVLNDLNTFYNSVEEGNYFSFFCARYISKNRKIFIMRCVQDSSRLSDVCVNFVILLIKSDAFHMFSNIIKEFSKILNDYLGVRSADVFFARAMSNETHSLVKNFLISKFGEGIKVRFRYNPSLIGGFAVNVGNYFFDCSINCMIDKIVNQALRCKIDLLK